jgi:carbohydrate kinase (thermoresistant glucokinase family)
MAVPPRIVVMGVSGSGKSEIASRVAAKLSVPFIEGDHYHSEANKMKMFAGVALTDDDRWPWLDAVGIAIATHERMIATCSALKRAYRDRLRESVDDLFFVELDGAKDLLASRLVSRHGHFMPSTLLDSQIETLEPLQRDEIGFRMDVTSGVGKLVATIIDHLERT